MRLVVHRLGQHVDRRCRGRAPRGCGLQPTGTEQRDGVPRRRQSVPTIAAEIEAARFQAIADEGDLVLGLRRDPRSLRWYLRLPQWLRVPLMRTLVLGSPRRSNAAMGNVMVTTVGMTGRARGWMVPSSVHPLCVALGSLGEKPAVVGGAVVPRTILHVTVLIDRDVVDGMPAARFVADAVRRLEGAVGAVGA